MFLALETIEKVEGSISEVSTRFETSNLLITKQEQ